MESSAAAVNLKITDLPVNCLEKIFRLLDIQDLLSVADTCKCFKTAADLAYASNFAKLIVIIKDLKPYDVEIHYQRFSYPHIEIGYLKPSFQILRLFGHLISKLEIRINEWDYDDEYFEEFEEDEEDLCVEFFRKSFSKVIRYINEYSAGTLTEIRIRTAKNIDYVQYMDRPFPNAEIVDIELWRWPSGLVKTLFPKLRLLKCYYKKNIDVANIADHFPNLEHVEFTMNIMDCVMDLGHILDVPEDNARPVHSFLLLNPQLQSLRMPLTPDARIFQCISENMPNLVNLAFR